MLRTELAQSVVEVPRAHRDLPPEATRALRLRRANTRLDGVHHGLAGQMLTERVVEESVSAL
eukprot:scaffold2161_cov244-Pinguiococcus_pyrenoidosus.AAC.13